MGVWLLLVVTLGSKLQLQSMVADKMTVLRQMRDLAGEMRMTMGRGDLAEFGALLHQGWELKRSLGFGISNAGVDEWYQAARDNGAMGGDCAGLDLTGHWTQDMNTLGIVQTGADLTSIFDEPFECDPEDEDEPCNAMGVCLVFEAEGTVASGVGEGAE